MARFSSLVLHLQKGLPKLAASIFESTSPLKLGGNDRASGALQGPGSSNMSAPNTTDPPSASNTAKTSYLSDTIASYTSWSGRTSAPKPEQKEKEPSEPPARRPNVPQGGDHSISSNRHRIRPSLYPRDCPKLEVQWFHAIDVAKRKPNYMYSGESPNEKETAAPKKWNQFSAGDSREIEKAFQELADKQDLQGASDTASADHGDISLSSQGSAARPNRALDAAAQDEESTVTVPVNEDYLFDVDVQRRELGPAYWLGPIYEVRRGTWFFIDGSTLKPCEENLATQLEEGYIKLKPWRRGASENRSASQSRTETGLSRDNLRPKGSDSNLARKAAEQAAEEAAAKREDRPPQPSSLMTHRLFGAYMNQVVTFEDASAAWLLSDDFMSRMSGSMYQRFAGGAHFSGTKVVRGWSDLKKKAAAAKDGKRSASPSVSAGSTEDKKKDPSRRKSAPPNASELRPGTPETPPAPKKEDEPQRPPLSRIATLERQMSNLVSGGSSDNPEKQIEEEREREEQEIADDYRDVPGDPQDREIEHLILVTHGIGQRLGARFETFNFIHDVNELRKNLKSVYGTSPDLQALNAEVNRLPQNCRIQVLPICWRHHLDFPQQGVKYNRREHDIADLASDEDESYPTLQNITVEGVPALRAIVADLALDILLYQTPAYKDHISRIVVKECNRIFKLFRERNPYFNGKVSLIGHSLGSAVMFDVLSEQVKDKPALQPSRTSSMRIKHKRKDANTQLQLNFHVDSFFCLGSPIGLFQMLKGKTIAGRPNPNKVTLDGGPDSLDDFFEEPALSSTRFPTDSISEAQFDAMVSSPKCRALFNIFHPTDPIAYRIEPLISPAMSTMKPQPLPYTKKSFFGAPSGQGITGIPAKVGQSFSGFWSNFSSGLAQNFITRSIGLSAEDQARLELPHQNPSHAEQLAKQAVLSRPHRQSVGAGTGISAGGVVSAQDLVGGVRDGERKRKLDEASIDGKHPPTLLDSEIETLYSGFQKQRRDSAKAAKKEQGEGAEVSEELEEPSGFEEKSRRLRREEAKVRGLNGNGRVDYSIQE